MLICDPRCESNGVSAGKHTGRDHGPSGVAGVEVIISGFSAESIGSFGSVSRGRRPSGAEVSPPLRGSPCKPPWLRRSRIHQGRETLLQTPACERDAILCPPMVVIIADINYK